jgi:hypothetical protein
MFGQPLQLGLQEAEALERHLVRLHVVDADLQVVEPRLVEPADPLLREVVAVRDERRDHAPAPHARDHRVELGVHERLSPAHRDHGRAQLGQLVQPPQHDLERDGLGDGVVLVAVRAGEVAAAHGHDVHEEGMAGVDEGVRRLGRPAQRSMGASPDVRHDRLEAPPTGVATKRGS